MMNILILSKKLVKYLSPSWISLLERRHEFLISLPVEKFHRHFPYDSFIFLNEITLEISHITMRNNHMDPRKIIFIMLVKNFEFQLTVVDSYYKSF